MIILSECNLAKVVAELLSGKIFVLPTETSYGLCCDATDQAAVDTIFAIKGRPSDKPLLVVVPTIDMAKKYLVWNDVLEKLAAHFWPGALTVVGEYSGQAKLAQGVVGKDNTVAVRVSNDRLLVSITEKIRRPLVATSANLSAAGDSYSASDIRSAFEKQAPAPDYFLNAGDLPRRPPTTIVSVAKGRAEVLRQGEVVVPPEFLR